LHDATDLSSSLASGSSQGWRGREPAGVPGVVNLRTAQALGVDTAQQTSPDDLASARDLASRVSAALDEVQTARLNARLPNGHRTELDYVAPDRVTLREWDESGQAVAYYVIQDDIGYSVRPDSGCRRAQNEGFRTQVQVFRPT